LAAADGCALALCAPAASDATRPPPAEGVPAAPVGAATPATLTA
jgi:hypothetical protein